MREREAHTAAHYLPPCLGQVGPALRRDAHVPRLVDLETEAKARPLGGSGHWTVHEHGGGGLALYMCPLARVVRVVPSTVVDQL